MKYEVEITIDLPRDRVVEFFDNPDNLKEWMPGLKKFEHLSGEPGRQGAKSKLQIENKGRTMEMVETITKRNLPMESHSTYEAPGVWNLQENYFTETETGKTHWRSVCEFKGTNLTMKIIMALMPGAFKKESLGYLTRFKAFAESESE